MESFHAYGDHCLYNGDHQWSVFSHYSWEPLGVAIRGIIADLDQAEPILRHGIEILSTEIARTDVLRGSSHKFRSFFGAKSGAYDTRRGY